MAAGRVLIALDAAALTAAPTWTRIDNVDNLVAGVDIRTGRQTEFDQTEASTATVYINDTHGVFDPNNASSPYFGRLDGKQIMLQLYNPVTATWVPQWRGFIDDYGFDIHPSQVVSNVQIECVDVFEYLAGVEVIPGSFGDTPPAGSERIVYYVDTDVQTRIVQLLTEAGIDPAMTRVFTGNVDVIPTKYDPGDSLMIALRDAADAEFPGIANIFVNKLGFFCFHGRKARFDPEGTAFGTDWAFTRWKAGDGAAVTLDASRAQIQPPLRWTRGRSRVINAGLAYPRGISDTAIAGQAVIDATSRDAFGYRSWSAQDLILLDGITTGNTADVESKLYATYYVANYKDPHTRVEGITFKSFAPSDVRAAKVWALICGADISDVINLSVTYPGGSTGLSAAQFFIEGYEMQIRALNTSYDMVEVTYNVTPDAYYSTDPFV